MFVSESYEAKCLIKMFPDDGILMIRESGSSCSTDARPRSCRMHIARTTANINKV